MAWNDQKPSPADIPNLELVSLLTSNKVAFRQGIEKHSFWTDSSTNSIGVPRLSDGSFGPGSARAYFAPQSSVSTGDSLTKAMSGRLFVTSDTSRLFGWAEATTLSNILLGSKNAMVYQTGSQATIATNTRNLVQISAVSVVATSSGTSYASVVFPTTYNSAPQVQVQGTSVATTTFVIPSVLTITTSGFSVALRRLFGPVDISANVFWRSHGTGAL